MLIVKGAEFRTLLEAMNERTDWAYFGFHPCHVPEWRDMSMFCTSGVHCSDDQKPEREGNDFHAFDMCR